MPRFTVFVGQREAVPGGLDPGSVRGLAAIRHLADYSPIHEREQAPRNAFAIERRAGLQRVIRIVVDRDVVAEQLCADAVAQEAAAVGDGGGAEVAEHLAYQVQDRRRLQDYRVSAGRQFDGISRSLCLGGSRAGHAGRVEIAVRAGAAFRPSGAVGRHGGDGEVGHRLGVIGELAARV